MSKRIWIVFLFIVAFQSLAFGQLQKTIHKTFALDSTEIVNLELYGAYEIEIWAGDNILTETKIQLYNASKTILNFFVEKGRYEIENEKVEKTLFLRSKDQNRAPIKNKKGESKEVISVRIFIPDTFSPSGDNTWVKTGG